MLARHDEQLIRQLAENVEHVFWIADVAGSRCFYVSPAYRTVFGRDPEELYRDLGSWAGTIHENDRTRVLDLVTDTCLRRQGFEIEYRIRRPDGEVRWIRSRAFPLREDPRHTDVQRIAGVSEDITERKRAAEALSAAARSSARFAAALENLTTGVLITDPHQQDNPIIYTNPGFMRMTGYEDHEILGRNCRFVQGPGTDPAVLQQIRQAINRGLPFKGRILNYRKDGVPFWNELTISPVFDAHGGLINFVGLQSDVTERVRAEEQIEQQLREKTVLLQEVHHRVKNNLQVISSLLNLQIRAMRDPTAIKALQESRSRIQAIAIAHEMLYRSRNLGRVELGEYIRSLAQQLQRSHVAERRVAVRLELQACLVELSQAVLCGLLTSELLSNALKHAFPASRPGEVWIRIETRRNLCTLTVGDNGVGMPSDLGSTAGIGMQLVADLVHQLRATMEINRRGGTEFRIVFSPWGEAG